MTAIPRAIGEHLVAQAAEGKAQCTVQVYGARLRRFAHWCASQGKTETGSLSPVDLRGYIAHLQANGNGTGTPRQNAVVIKAFSKWLASEGKIRHDPFATVKLGKPSHKIHKCSTPTLTHMRRASVDTCTAPPHMSRGGDRTMITDAIAQHLSQGKTIQDLLALGYKKGTIYAVQRKLRQQVPKPEASNVQSPQPPAIPVHTETVSEVDDDPEILQLKKELRKAQLERQFRELKASLEVDVKVSALWVALSEVRREKQQKCSFYKDACALLKPGNNGKRFQKSWQHSE